MRSKKNDNWKFTVKFGEDDPIAYYSYTSSGIPQGYEHFWDFMKNVTNRKLMGLVIERIEKTVHSECLRGNS